MEKDNVDTDYSCGNCGWWGWFDECDEDDCCPKCGSEQIGEVTEEDFKEGNALFSKLWRGREILNKTCT